MTNHEISCVQSRNTLSLVEEGKNLTAIRLLQDMDLATAPEGVSVLAVALFRLSRTVKAKVSHAANTGSDPLGLVAWRILMGLSLVTSANQRELVEFVSTEQAQASRVLKDLIARGLITSKPSPTDGRARSISITELGSACRAQHMPAMSALAEQIDDALSPTETTQFLDMCNRIAAALHAKQSQSTSFTTQKL